MSLTLRQFGRSSGDPTATFPPEFRQRFLRHAFPEGFVPTSAVRLHMHGEIRLKTWTPFHAEEVLHHSRGFVWKARVGLLLRGGDSFVDGAGACSWKLLGLIPVVRASGPDIDRSAAGRWMAESILLPGMLLPELGADWAGDTVTLRRHGETMTLNLTLDNRGALQGFRTLRWGNPAGAPFGDYPFGGAVEEERTFGGVTIPSRLRIGWHVGTPAWQEGEFFRMTVDDARFR